MLFRPAYACKLVSNLNTPCRASESWRSIWSRIALNREGAYWKILNDGWYDVQAVEWRRGRSAGGEFRRDVLRESKIARIQVRKNGARFRFSNFYQSHSIFRFRIMSREERRGWI